MAEAAKKTISSPPKIFRIPADTVALGSAGNHIVSQMRAWHHWRMTDGVKQIRKGAQKK